MGIYDRDYYRPGSQRPFGSLAMWSVTTWLIVINVVVFFIDGVSERLPSQLGWFSVGQAVFGLQIWRFITFQFLHASIWHIFFNMLSLYYFGPMVESYLGPRKFLAYYLICGIGGALSFIALVFAGVIQDGMLIGASAGIFGVLVGAARIAPNTTVMLMFPPIPLKLRTLAWVFIGIAAYTIFSHGMNAGGQAAHLGGAVIGAILIFNDRWLNFLNFRRTRFRYGGRRAVIKDWRNDFDR